MKAQRAGLVTVAVLSWGLAYGSQFATTVAQQPQPPVKPIATMAPAPTPEPTHCWVGCHVKGAIGTPLSTHKPPKEPRLTMPPTDTQP